MATTKKKTLVKKSSSKNAKNSVRPWSWRFSILTIGIYTIAVSTLVVAAFIASSALSNERDQKRLDRIQDIYSSLSLGDDYRIADANVFGDKREYSNDNGRTYSSAVKYQHADTVSNTVADLDGKIKAAGFTFENELNPGSAATQYHYKSTKGEYVRLTVSSKPYDDATANAYLMKKDNDGNVTDRMDLNAGPSNVIIKVNLDDNNE